MQVIKSVVFCDSAFCYYRMPHNKSLSRRKDRQVLIGALRYIDNAEVCFFKMNNFEAHSTLACLYKKLLLIATHDNEIVDNLRHRTIKLGFVPDCNKNVFIYFCRKIFGVRITFWFVYLRTKYLT